ncbi:oligosaccharide biosynthesis protein Alg14 [Vreelandella profundi]|uniref:oligosaccharide biosynthesis protein Alg14 n=1 Tax=Vreelandella profundi TaxID=2852117 RepID=UPI001EF1358F|nr:oligosaccharide biosynthesis protein Alg14 [Halomonas profundi]
MKILMVASFGGHFIQLKRLHQQIRERIEGEEVMFEFATTAENVALNNDKAHNFPNVHRGSGWGVMIVVFKRAYKLLKLIKPDVVISTGALPGLIVCLMAKLLGKKVIWVDSMANYQKLSFSGHVAKYFCNICLTQWEHLAENDDRVVYWGKVL